jgi:hypothetical protein
MAINNSIVVSVAGKDGEVILDKADVGLANVDNVSSSDLRDRTTHTGQQASSTISDFTAQQLMLEQLMGLLLHTMIRQILFHLLT